MRDGVTGIPTGTLVRQWQAVIESMKGGSFYTRAEVDALLKSVNPFPVGSIYQSTDPTSPAALFGGSWEEIASERVLMGASSSHAAGTTVEAGLPNIKGQIGDGKTQYSGVQCGGLQKGTYITGAYRGTYLGEASWQGAGDGIYSIKFDASRSSAIYGASTTVQPAAYYVHIWHRVA